MRRSTAFLAIVLVLMTLYPVVGASHALRTSPTLESPRAVRLEAGRHTAFRFDEAGQVIERRTRTFTEPTESSSTRRRIFVGRGWHLRLAEGAFAGWWVRESPIAYVRGRIGLLSFDPPLTVTMPAGRIIGYRFDAGWRLTTAEIARFDTTATAAASQDAVINGIGYYRIMSGPFIGTWVPRAAAGTTRRLDCRTGPKPAAGGQQILTTIAGAGASVALTFDMGGRLDPARKIMKKLLLYGVCTTIFPTGAASQTSIGSAVLDMVEAYPQVFEVGNHTMDHCDLVNGGGGIACPATRPSDAFIREELTDAAAIIRAGSGQRPAPYWRPPYGAYDTAVRAAAASVGYTKTVMWGVDTIDWKRVSRGGPTAASMAAKVVNDAQRGTIVLMHLGGWNTANALPWILWKLRSDRDLAPTSLSDLVGS
jgi:peptidoglycan/xylan/chitin deacetylase (PgdA/CDA1 family)